jgi:hypothetical protein
MMMSKIELKCFQINLMLELFMCLSWNYYNYFKKFMNYELHFFFKILIPNS